jgi:uncharacterized protein (DUF4415 family)
MPKLKPDTLSPGLAEEAAIEAGIAADAEAREWTEEAFAEARPAAEVLPAEAYAALVRPRGRPKAENPKIFTAIRLDAEVLHAFKRTGKGWQTRINAALRRYLEEHGA